MRRHASLIELAAFVLPVAASAQVPSTASAKALQGDYVVPDAPALLMLGLNESKLLRPSSVQQLTSNLATASNTFSMVPTALAVEFSPMMLIRGPRLSIAEYQANPMLYRTRLSFAANKDSATRRSRIALGFRMSLDDKSDLRTDPGFLAAIDRLTSLKIDSARAVEAEMTAQKVPLLGPLTPAQQSTKDAIIVAVKNHHDAILKDSLQAAGSDMANAVAAVKRAKEDVAWNASVSDIALGLRGSSVDSSGKQARFDGFSGWATKGIAISDFAQLLVGGRYAYERDTTARSELQSAGDLVVRMYAGSNRYKISLEAQGTGRESSRPKWGLSLGGEFEPLKSIWVEFSSGWRTTGSMSTGALTHSVSFHLAPPNQ
ncbi:MAG: hypothetical protein ABI625_12340 [bacterium]